MTNDELEWIDDLLTYVKYMFETRIEKVKLEERERCTNIAKRLRCELPPGDYRITAPGIEGLVEDWEVYQCYHGDRIAAAIREEDDDG